jgi:hypothetical protein
MLKASIRVAFAALLAAGDALIGSGSMAAPKDLSGYWEFALGRPLNIQQGLRELFVYAQATVAPRHNYESHVAH